MKNFFEEFKTFAMRGNVVDLAIAVVIGGAFGKIVTSLVDDIVMPIIGLLTGGMDFSNVAWTLKEAQGDVPAVTVNYGMFVNTLVTFTIVAFVIFILIKMMNKLKTQEEDAPKEAKPTKDQILLMEIRDALTKK
jgi:large conductance mechanosensitive channel